MSAMPLTGQPFICIHGSLRRSCETCDLAERLEVCEKERDAALAESQHDKELTCGCGLYVHHSRWNPKARHINDCPFQTLASLETALAERDRFGANAENFRQSMYALESDLVSLAQERDALRDNLYPCHLYTSPSPRDRTRSRMPSSA